MSELGLDPDTGPGSLSLKPERLPTYYLTRADFGRKKKQTNLSPFLINLVAVSNMLILFYHEAPWAQIGRFSLETRKGDITETFQESSFPWIIDLDV